MAIVAILAIEAIQTTQMHSVVCIHGDISHEGSVNGQTSPRPSYAALTLSVCTSVSLEEIISLLYYHYYHSILEERSVAYVHALQTRVAVV